MVRCFQDDNVAHVDGSLDPRRDAEVVNTELLLRDLESVEKRLPQTAKVAKTGDKAAKLEAAALEKAQAALGAGQWLRTVEFSEAERTVLDELFLLTMKTQVYVANISDGQIGSPDDPVLEGLRRVAAGEGSPLKSMWCSTSGAFSVLNRASRSSAQHMYSAAIAITSRPRCEPVGSKTSKGWISL